MDIYQAGGGVGANSIDKTHLSQDFGASSTRLQNLITEPISNDVIRIASNVGGGFTANINGAPSATSVVYDGEANENFWSGISSGATQWGRILLHNSTRGNYRKVVTVNRATNTITTESSTDDWANNDNLTIKSPTVNNNQFFDIDLSAEVAATVSAIYLKMNVGDLSSAAIARAAIAHSFEAHNTAKRMEASFNLATEQTIVYFFLKVVSQKIALWITAGTNNYILLQVAGIMEPADT